MRIRLEYGLRDTVRFWQQMYPERTRTWFTVCCLAIFGVVAMYAAYLVPIVQPVMLSFWLYLAGLAVLWQTTQAIILLVLMNVGHWRANGRKKHVRR